jgi:hypothetical protein
MIYMRVLTTKKNTKKCVDFISVKKNQSLVDLPRLQQYDFCFKFIFGYLKVYIHKFLFLLYVFCGKISNY